MVVDEIIGTCFIGPSGAGKTTLTKKLGQKLGIEMILETPIPKNLHKNVTSSEANRYFITEEKAQINTLKRFMRDKIPFVSDVHPGGFYSTYNRISQPDYYRLIIRNFLANTLNNINIGMLTIDKEKVIQNLNIRGAPQNFIDLVSGHANDFAKLYLELRRSGFNTFDMDLNSLDICDDVALNDFIDTHRSYFPKKLR